MSSASASVTNQLPSIKSSTIFLPGTLCDERIWFPIWQRLNLHDRSYVPLQWAESLEQMLALTQDRIDQATSKVTLIGFSMGGYVAALASLQAHNVDKISQLILIGYSPSGLSQLETRAREFILKMIKAKQFAGMSQARLEQYFTLEELQQDIPSHAKHNQMVQTILDMQDDLGSGVLFHQINATTPRQDLTQKLATHPIKQTYVSATHDKIAQCSDIKRHCEKAKQATFIEIKNSAHITPLSQADALANIIASQINN